MREEADSTDKDITAVSKSITARWFINVFSIIVAVIAAIVIMLCLIFQSRYYTAVYNTAQGYSKGLSLLATCDEENFSSVAKEYVEQFAYKDKIEIQIFDNDGKILITSNGFEPGKEKAPDYELAVKNQKASKWVGKNQNGEKIMAETTLLTDFGKGSNGAVRWVVSLSAVDRRIFLICLCCVAVGLGFLALAWISGNYFITSIVRPMREVSKMARKIALGELDSRIETDDRSEIGELCDSINYMASELKQAETMKNDFISSVSHELRTPLTAIRGWSETARMSVGSDDEIVKRGLDVVLNESERLSGLVEELLDFSRMQSGRLLMETEQVDIRAVLSEAVDMYVELAKQQEIELSFLPLPNEVYVKGDKNRIKQVFINIVDNAIKYTQKGGHVIVSQYEEEGCVLTKVTDTGVGIPAQDIDRVKEKFFKSNKKVRGSGIGLAVADEIVKQHNGLLFLESKEGVGTTATVALPLFEPVEEITEEIIPPAQAQPAEKEKTAETDNENNDDNRESKADE